MYLSFLHVIIIYCCDDDMIKKERNMVSSCLVLEDSIFHILPLPLFSLLSSSSAFVLCVVSDLSFINPLVFKKLIVGALVMVKLAIKYLSYNSTLCFCYIYTYMYVCICSVSVLYMLCFLLHDLIVHSILVSGNANLVLALTNEWAFFFSF